MGGGDKIGSGINNTVIGSSAGGANLTTNGNITLIGANTTVIGSNLTGSTAIGYNAQATTSNQIVLGTISEFVSIPGTAASTSTATGALRVSGGAGIAGNVYAGGSIVSTTGTGTVSINVPATSALMVAVGSDTTDTICTSTDGIIWTGRGNFGTCYDVKWNGTYWLAASANNNVYKSYDGITWTAGTSPEFAFKVIEWNPNKSYWFGLTNVSPARVFLSKDGVAWSVLYNTGVTSVGTGMAFSPTFNVWIIATNGTLYQSANDGNNWSNVLVSTVAIVVATDAQVRWINDKFVVYGTTGTVQSKYSIDGANWNNTIGINNSSLKNIYWNGSTWMISTGNGDVFTSTDGVTWTISNNRFYLQFVIWWSSTYWIATFANSRYHTSDDTGNIWILDNTGTIMSTTNKITSTYSIVSVDSINAYTGALVVKGGVGIRGTVNIGGAANIAAPNLIVAVGSNANNAIYTSSDGISWVGRGVVSPATTFTCVKWNNSYFMACGSTNSFFKSYDGITRTSVPGPAGGPTNGYTAIDYSQGSNTWIAIANCNTSTAIALSSTMAKSTDDGVNWNALSGYTGTGSNPNPINTPSGIAFAQSHWRYTMGSNNYYYNGTPSSGSNWTISE